MNNKPNQALKKFKSKYIFAEIFSYVYTRYKFEYFLRNLCKDTHRYLNDASLLNLFPSEKRHLVINPSTWNIEKLFSRVKHLVYDYEYTIEFTEAQTLTASIIQLERLVSLCQIKRLALRYTESKEKSREQLMAWEIA